MQRKSELLNLVVQMKYLLVFFSLPFFLIQNYREKEIAETIVKILREYRLDSIPYYLNYIENPSLKKAFQYQYDQLIIPTEENTINLDGLEVLDDFGKTILLYSYADMLQHSSRDSMAFKHYLEAFQTAKKSQNHLLLNETLRKINSYLTKDNTKNLNLFHSYVEKYKKAASSKYDVFWSLYYEKIKVFQSIDRNSGNLPRVYRTAGGAVHFA